MFPIFVLFGREISMYALMAVVGLLAAGVIFCIRIRKAGYDDNEAILFLLVLGVGMLVGGHILFGITNVGSFYLLLETKNFSELMSVLGKLFGGSVFYGGLIGAYILGLIYVKCRKLPLDVYMDSSALFAPVFHGFARIGCFLGGCCYGIESDFGFSAHGNNLTDIGDVCRFPVQLLESFGNFVIAGIIFLVLKKGWLRGRVFYLYLSMYAVLRFFDEFLRGDEIRGFVLGLSTSQFISIFVELFALAMLILFAARSRAERKKY